VGAASGGDATARRCSFKAAVVVGACLRVRAMAWVRTMQMDGWARCERRKIQWPEIRVSHDSKTHGHPLAFLFSFTVPYI
jgi:hypothetical protein